MVLEITVFKLLFEIIIIRSLTSEYGWKPSKSAYWAHPTGGCTTKVSQSI